MRSTIDVLSPFSRSALDAEKGDQPVLAALTPSDDQTISPQMPKKVKFIDCYTVTARELESITTKYNFTSMLRAPLHGFAFWFDAEFNGPSTLPANNNLLCGSSASDLYSTVFNNQRRKIGKSDHEVLLLSTAPEDKPTHWQQTILYLYEPIQVIQDQIIEGSVTISQSKENPRFLNIHLEYSSGGRSFIKESIMR